MRFLIALNAAVGAVFFICYSYHLIYLAAGLFRKKRESAPGELHDFAVLIPARNEEKVIGDLLRALAGQTYPREKITAFVVADNCTDNTAAVARDCGAVVYERRDTERIGKGYALSFLMRRIGEDYGRDAFDAFFVFDADNVPEPDFIEEMNKTYSAGYKIVTGYRNSKNYGDNWISAGYGLWFIREARFLNGPRTDLGLSCAVSGTGFMFDRSVAADGPEETAGWRYFLLTEDIEFSAAMILSGERIGYCGTAVFYDEQPVTFRQSWRQRLRWAKGYLQVFGRYGRDLFASMFRRKTGGVKRFPCFDMLMTVLPAIALSCFVIAADAVGAVVCAAVARDPRAVALLLILPLFNAYAIFYVMGLITTLAEWRNIHTSAVKKILYTFTLPLFVLTYIPITATALFSRKVRWTPIDHTKSRTVEEIKTRGKKRK